MPASEVFHKFKTGALKSSGGGKVTSRKQEIAIYLSEKRNESKHGGHYKEGKKHGSKSLRKR